VSLVDVARAIATSAHDGQVDKSGRPYIGHPTRVAKNAAAAGGDDRVVAAAWLHDVLEDTNTTAADLAAAGIPPEVIDAVLAVTKVPDEPVDSYFARINADPIAIRVKHADLADNTDPDRVRLLDQATRERLAAKYARARRLLAPLP